MKKEEQPEKDSVNEGSELSPEHAARIVTASLMNQPVDSKVFSLFINNVHRNEQFLLMLMKTVQPRSIAFFENVIGICETRIKETAEDQKMKAAGKQQRNDH